MIYYISMIFGAVGVLLLIWDTLFFNNLKTKNDDGTITWNSPIYGWIHDRILTPAMLFSMLIFLSLQIVDSFIS